MSGGDCRQIRPALGVYVLGAIEPAERAEVDEHLSWCPACREELSGLAGLPALLHRVPVSEAERLAAGHAETDQPVPEPAGVMLDGLLARAAGARRARVWRGVLAASVAVLVALGGGLAAGIASAHPPVAAVGGNSGTQPQPGSLHLTGAWQTVTHTNARLGVTLTVRYARTSWGTVMSVQTTGVQPGTRCQFAVTDSSGRTWTVGGWQVAYSSRPTWYPAATWVASPAVRSFDLTSGGAVLVRAATG